jgi:hypothetical protein
MSAPPVTVDAIRTLLAGRATLLVLPISDGRAGVLVSLRYETSAEAIADGPRILAALEGASYSDFDDPTDVIGGPEGYEIQFEVRK